VKTVTKKILATKTSHLPVPLTSAELAQVAEQMGRIEGDLRAFYARKKEVSADLKAKEEALDAEMGKLGRLQRDKQEYRPVSVRVEADFEAGKVYEIREDTGEVVGERPVTEQDRQVSIFNAPPVDELRREAGKAVARMNEAAEKLDKSAAEREAKKASKASPALEWSMEPDGRVLGVAADGLVYSIEAMGNGPVPFRWKQGRNRSTSSFGTIAAAKEDAERAEAKRAADAILENSGDGALVPKKRRGKKGEARP
jgi:hypothetical protein